MITIGVAAALLVLAALDGTFSGFRSSVGRTGLIRHRAADRIAARRGLGLLAALMVPTVVITIIDVVLRPHQLAVYTRAGTAMLLVYGSYGLVVLVALAVYTGLSWRWKYLASAVILGPFTAVRPLVAVAGGVVAVLVAPHLVLGTAVTLAVAAVLAVEPLADRLFYGAPTRSRRYPWARSSPT